MNGETEDSNTPVRRSSRARKPNSRFADDELDGCFKKIVTGLTPPDPSSASSGASPARPKKGGKKKEGESEEKGGTEEVEEKAKNKAYVEESEDSVTSANSIGVVPLSESRHHEVVNGLLCESEAVTDNMGKTKSSGEKSQERRTRSNAKNVDLASLPTEEKKRGGRKGGKGKIKGSDIEFGSEGVKTKEKGNVKSDYNVEGIPDESLQAVEKDEVQMDHIEVGECQAETSKDLTSIQEDEHFCNVKDSENVDKCYEHLVLGGNVETDIVNREVNKTDFTDDQSKNVSGNERETGILPKKDDIKGSKDVKMSIDIISETHKSTEGGDECLEGVSQMSVKPVPCTGYVHETVSHKLSISEQPSCVSESFENPEVAKEFFEEGDDIGNQETKPEFVKEDANSNEKVEVNMENEPCNTSRSTPSTSQEEKIIVSNADASPSKQKDTDNADSKNVTSEPAGHVDFTEAETSTPTRRKGRPDSAADGAFTPTRRRGRSNSSEAEASTPSKHSGLSVCTKVEITQTRRRGRSDSSEHETFSSARRGRSNSSEGNVPPIPEQKDQTIVSDVDTSSPHKRRGRSSKKPLIEGLREEDKKSQNSSRKGTKKSETGIKIDTAEMVISGGDDTQEEKISVRSEASQDIHNIQIFETNEFNQTNKKLEKVSDEVDPESSDVGIGEDLTSDCGEIQSRDTSVTSGKRNRSEQLNEERVGEQEIAGYQESPLAKRRREDRAELYDVTQEEDQKRKRQDEPEEENVKRKRKRDDDDNEELCGATVLDKDEVDNNSEINESTASDVKSKTSLNEMTHTKDGIKANEIREKIDSGRSVKGNKPQHHDEEENSDIKERRQSSVGSILSLLKRPDVAKIVDDSSDRKQKGVDHKSSETKKREDKRWKAETEANRKEERKGRTVVDEPTESKKRKDKVLSDEKHGREKKSGFPHESKRRDSAQDDSLPSSAEYSNNSRNIKDFDTDNASSFSWGDIGSMSWDIMKDPAPSVSETSSQKIKKFKNVVRPDSASKGNEAVIKGDKDEDKTDIEDRRNSSIGNILSFLKRGNPSGPQQKQDESHSTPDSNTVTKLSDEAMISDFIERHRMSNAALDDKSNLYTNREERDDKSILYGKREDRDDNSSLYTKREDSDSYRKSKSLPKAREKRVSRWSDREECTDTSSNQWENIHSYPKAGVLPSSDDGNRSNWSEKRSSAIPSLGNWENVPSQFNVQDVAQAEKHSSAPSLSSEERDTSLHYGNWNDQSSTWKNWTGERHQGSRMSPKGSFESGSIEKEKLDDNSPLKEPLSDDENIDFGNREGMSEFIESYADELDQSDQTDQTADEVLPNRNQPHYHDERESSSLSRRPTWPLDNESSRSPDRDLYLSPRNKEPNSPPREPVWSPRSSEIVLSPKSRELMSSLRNMEVKLTPQMQELMSSQQNQESALPQELHHYPLNRDDPSSFRRTDGSNSYDVLSIPLPDEAETSFPRTQKSMTSFVKSEFGSKPQHESQMLDAIRAMNAQEEEERGNDFESSWRSHSESFDRPHMSRYNVKSEHSEDVKRQKEESDDDQHFEERDHRFIDEVHDDKENLQPKLEEEELTEEEKLEIQLKKERDSEAKEERNKLVVEQRMKSFVHLKDNLYIGDRKKSKKSKEVRRMVCDCSLSKEEMVRGEVGCGEDCLNRLLMIECGSRCPIKDRCTNKRFQNYHYQDVEVFNADEKGCGIRACTTIPAGSFIMEYVGEVFDAREFKRRRKEYSRNHNAHFYFMALKGDLFIDATRKGNISRFINHSCDPNAQTQKWTVNGELRVGFFSKKDIEVGEEINFDYRLERYGREPQRCYCGTAICRGWLGESPDEKTKEEKEEEKRQERDRRKREEKRLYLEDNDLEEEIDKLNTIKLRTRQDVLNLCRLMVRADNFSARLVLLHLVQSSTSACKRLFMDYHGLSVLWSWMADLGYAYEHASIKIEILKTLECLPITNKTQLTDSRILGVVERWSTQSVEIPASGSPPPPPPPRPGHLGPDSLHGDSESGKKSSDTSEDSDGEMDAKPVSVSVESSSLDDVSMDSVDVEQDALKSKPNLEGCLAEDDSSDSNQSDENKDKKRSAVEPGVGDAAATATPEDEAATQELLMLHKSMVELAIKLLGTWQALKEYYRIPKRERIELMKEHEREMEEEVRGLDKDRKEKDKYRRDFDRRRRSPEREKDKERHSSRRASRGDRDAREDRSSDSPKMSKEQRRQLFEIQARQEEEEAKQRKMQEEMWAMHVDRCRLLGQDPYLTPIFDPSCQYYWDPNTVSWQPYNGTDPNIPVPAAYGFRPSDSGDGSPMLLSVPPSHVIAAQPLAGHLAPDGEAATPNFDDPRIDPATIPLPGEITQTSPTQPLPCQAVPVEGTPPQGARVLTFPVSEAGTGTPTMPINIGASSLTLPFVVGEEPPPPPPGPITIQLPPRWKMARDSDGHVYFYHVKTRTSQWEPPTLEQHQQLEAGLGSDSDSDSSSSDSDSTSTTDSEDFSSDEEEEEEEVQVTTVERGELSDEKMIRRHRAKKPRSEALVQERVISPVLEMDKEAARRERREAKERAQKEARQERQEDKQVESSQENTEVNEIEPLTDKIQRMERHETLIEKERHEQRELKTKNRDKTKSKERAATAIADNSDSARKCKENFRAKMATYIVSVLNPYRRDDCRIGRITCNEDFKYLARKLTHFVMIKELKQLHSVEDLECNDSVKYKTKDFVRKYMSKYGHEFKRDPTDTKEY